LFHGTSSHYLASFPAGGAISPWSHKNEALALYRQVWQRLRIAGIEPTQSEQGALEERDLWQHGELFVSPSKIAATRYAKYGAANGGELLTRSVLVLERLTDIDAAAVQAIRLRFKSLERYLAGGGYPLLVEFTGVQMEGLVPERIGDTMQSLLSYLENARHLGSDDFDEDCQQINFRLRPDAGVVARIQRIDT